MGTSLRPRGARRSRRREGNGRCRRLTVLAAITLAAILPCAAAAGAATDYQARTWGINSNGELGIGTLIGPETCVFGEACATSPQLPGELTGVAGVAAGAFHSLAAMSDGTVMAWGFNGSGQLGHPGVEESSTPVAVEGLSGVVAVAAGHEFSLALLANGTVMAWGEDNFGQLGNASHTPSQVPIAVGGLSEVRAITAGPNHALALLANGTVMAWGAGAAGQLGDGQSAGSDVPVPVSGLSGVASVAAGRAHSLARLTNGTVKAWGEGAAGQLGNGKVTSSNVPVTVSGLANATAVAAGGAHSVALLGTGQVVAWGEDTQGELGDGGATDSDKPVSVGGLTAITAIAAGDFHSLALGAGGTVWSWGYGGNGQLGVGGTEDSHTPVAVPGLQGIKGLAGGHYDSLAFGPPPPAVSTVSPQIGSTAGGSPVTITGTDLAEAVQVLFGSTPAASFTVESPTSIRAISPPGTGTVDVTVMTPAGLSATGPGDQFTYVLTQPAPTVTGLGPSQGSTTGGTSVAISGTSFEEASQVQFGSTPATSFTVESPTSITAVSPPGTGTVDVKVTGPGGISEAAAADRFLYVSPGPAPTIAKLAPNRGPTAGGTTVTISGSNLTGASAVTFGGAPAAGFEVTAPGRIRAVSPPGVSGAAEVRVTTPAGTSEASTKDLFTYGPPTVSGVSPSSGPNAGGTAITVTGTGFAPGTTTKFAIGKAVAVGVQCSSSTTCTMQTGASRKKGALDVRAKVGKALSPKSPPGDRFTYE